MAYPQRPKNPKIYHSTLVGQGPTLAFITKPVHVGQRKDGQGSFAIAVFNLNGVDTDYFLPDGITPDTINRWAGQSVLLQASGDDRQGTAQLVITPATGTPAAAPPAQPAAQPAQQAAPPNAVTPPATGHGLIDVKKHLCQASNLMRMAVKKSRDIQTEWDLPDAWGQGMAGWFYGHLKDRGYIEAMPLEPFTPADLGANALQAREHVTGPADPPYEPGADDDTAPPF